MSGRGTWTAWGAAWVLGGFAAGCAPDKGASELHAAQVLLERDVKGLRESVAKLEVGSLAITEHMIWLGADVAWEWPRRLPNPDVECRRLSLRDSRATQASEPLTTDRAVSGSAPATKSLF